MKRVILLNSWAVFLTVCALAQAGSSGPAAEPKKPTLLVSFERQSIRESDSLLIDVLANTQDKDLTDAVLQITSPNFLLWYEVGPENTAGTVLHENKLEIGKIAANSLIRKRIRVESKPIIQVGSFNLLFTIEFKSDGKDGFISAEKTLQASLFGSDTIAGVPLALAGFIVPGLFFWVITSWFRIPWSVGIALGDKMIYSVLVSIGFVLIGTWIKFIDIDVRKGIGVIKLLYLAGGGAALGVLVGIFTLVFLNIRRRQESERHINFSEEPESIFRKLLLKNPNITQQQFSITLDNERGEEYVGSLFEQTPNTTSETGFTSIVGWCKIFNEIAPQAEPASGFKRLLEKFRLKNRKTPEQKWQQMQELFNNNKLVELYDLAKRERFIMGWEGVITRRQQGGNLEGTENKAMQWRNNELRGAPQPNESDKKPVRLV